MRHRLAYGLGLVGSITLVTISASSAVSTGQSGALVRLQSSTPGVVQTGHVNLGGTLLADAIGLGTNPSTKLEISGNTNQPIVRVVNSANFGPGIFAQNGNGWSRAFYAAAVRGDSSNAAMHGVSGHAEIGYGVAGMSYNNAGVFGYSHLGVGGSFSTEAVNGTALIASCPTGTAAYLDGNVMVTQLLSVFGSATVNSALTVSGNASVGSQLQVTGSAQINQNATINGNVATGGRVTATKLGINSSNPALSAEIIGSTSDVLLVQNTSTGRGLRVVANSDTGVWATTSSGFAAIDARTTSGPLAGAFSGNVQVSGTLSKGGGSFKIDHPLDPENKYLYHSFVESPDMKNIYDGVVKTDERGYATVTMPDWFDSLNRDFRYQLTVLDDGSDGDDWVMARVAQEMKGNQFTIRSSKPLTRVSWQVTGTRQDSFANAHRIPVEADKEPENRGLYLYPREAGMPLDRGIDEQRYRRMQGKQ